MKIVWSDPSSLSKAKELLSKEEFEIVAPRTWEEGEIKELVSDADVLVIRRVPPHFKVTEEIINSGKKLRLIQKIGTRVDFVNIEAANKAGILVSIMPVIGDKSVAEHAILLMLALSKNLVNCHKAVVDAEYLHLGIAPKQTTELSFAFNWVGLPIDTVYRKTLGLVGMGEIGREVARRAVGLEMKVLYYDFYRLNREKEEELKIEYRPFKEVLAESDFVSLHVPHTEETEKIIGQRELSLMKSTAFLINCARGGLVDEDALYQALKNKRIAGAALDVFREEPIPKDNPLLKLDNIIFTPHIAGGPISEQYLITLQNVCENISRVARGEKAANVIN